MKIINVGLEGRGYAIHVGHGILAQLGEFCRELELGQQVAVITDEAVAASYLAPVCAGLRAAGYEVLEVVFPGGDAAKNLEQAEQIFGRLIEAQMDRSAWVLALGGGVVGDMGGFVAATYLRGVSCVQVPTTIVAQVDASIGGKTAVNHRLGKNLIGAFHQPALVCIDTEALRTLPRSELVAGLAEVVKHAVIRDAELFGFLEENLEKVVELDLDPESLDWLIARNVGIKVEVVEADEREGGLRAILNYGHTIGHAIEAATDYKKYRHGEGVILGMIGAGHIAQSRGLWSAATQQRQDALLQRLGVPAGIAEVPAELIVERTRADKKRVAGKTRLILGREIGRVEIVDDFGEDALLEGVEYIQEHYG
jgi:3-dehydroquinate synthase